MPKPSPTAPWSVGPVRVRRVRGPHPDDPDLHDWRAEIRDDDKPRLVWAGWGRRQDPELSAKILAEAGKVAAAIEAEATPVDPTVNYLLGCWRTEQIKRHETGEIRRSSLKLYLHSVRYIATGLGSLLCDRLDTNTLRTYVRARQAGTVLGLPAYSPHALRRAACDALYESGADVGAAAKILGHSATTAIRRYRQPRRAHLHAAVDLAGLGDLPLVLPRAQLSRTSKKK